MAKKKSAKKSKSAKPAAKKKVAPIPAGYYTLTPYLVCRGAAKAIEFYKKALDAKEKAPDARAGRIDRACRAQDRQLDRDAGRRESRDGCDRARDGRRDRHRSLHLHANVDKAYAKAIAAGAKAEQPPTDMFWGDRYAKFSDPFGHKWSMATHIEDLSPKEMAKRGAEAMAQMAAAAGKP